MCRKYFLVVIETYNKQIPDVVKDYVVSLNIIFQVIDLNSLPHYLGIDDSIFILIQLKLTTDFFLNDCIGNKIVVNSNQIVFLNVEMLTEESRMQCILDILKYTNFTVADYSAENIKVIETYTKDNNINYSNKIVYLPYQFNIRENLVLQNLDDKYDYDVGIINAYVKPSPTVNPAFIYKRKRYQNC